MTKYLKAKRTRDKTDKRVVGSVDISTELVIDVTKKRNRWQEKERLQLVGKGYIDRSNRRVMDLLHTVTNQVR